MAAASSQEKRNETSADMLDNTVGRRVIRVMISYVRMVAGLHVLYLGSLVNIHAESGAGQGVCRCTRFLRKVWSFNPRLTVVFP